MARTLFSVIIFLTSLFSCVSSTENKLARNKSNGDDSNTKNYTLDITSIKSKADEALQFIKSKSMNEDFSILIE
jgi:hypothetical protein